MDYVIIRPPLVYGANAPGNFYSLLKLVRRGLPMPLASVRNQRSMIALDNIVDVIIACSTAPAAANELFLVADRTDVSTPELIRLLSQGMGRRARMLPVPVALLAAGARIAGKRNAFQQLCGSLRLDTAKARQLLGWRAPVDAHEGLRQAAAGFLKDK
jgi:nucleoside-diphosphate-sugar epimerase